MVTCEFEGKVGVEVRTPAPPPLQIRPCISPRFYSCANLRVLHYEMAYIDLGFLKYLYTEPKS